MNKNKNKRFFLLAAAISGFLSVALGAFAAHGLRNILESGLLQTFQTGVEYQFMHTLALFGIALLPSQSRSSNIAGWSFIVGLFLFSGSLYLLALTKFKAFGMITPVGGVCFLTGWFFLAVHAWYSYAEKNSDH